MPLFLVAMPGATNWMNGSSTVSCQSFDCALLIAREVCNSEYSDAEHSVVMARIENSQGFRFDYTTYGMLCTSNELSFSPTRRHWCSLAPKAPGQPQLTALLLHWTLGTRFQKGCRELGKARKHWKDLE